MRINIRSKLIIAISLLMVIVFASAAYLFINEKKDEISEDIYLNTLAFTKLTRSDISEFYETFLEQNSFVYFNREIQELFSENRDISRIRVVSYSGYNLYDSQTDIRKRYEGPLRQIDSTLLSQVKSENIAIKTLDGRIIFLKEKNGQTNYVDALEQPIPPLESSEFIEYIIAPASEKYSVVYNIDYTNLQNRVDRMIERIIYLAIFGILLGALLAFVLSGRISKPITKLVFGASEIAKGNFQTRVLIKTSDELNYLGTAFNKMAQDLEASIQAKIYQQKVSHELKIAGEIQKQIIPNTVPQIKGLDISADIISADEVGGDMYDFLKLSEDQMLMYLGDVTGHGVPAGIVSSIANALFFGYIDHTDLKEIIVKVNTVLKEKTMPNMFMTLCLMLWNAIENQFTYVSAGHEQIIHYRASSQDSALEPAGGIALGMLDSIANLVNPIDVDLQPGDVLVIYSDGIPEAWRNQKETYGMARFINSVTKNSQLQSAKEIKDAIIKDVNDFRNNYKQQDDITIIVIKKI